MRADLEENGEGDSTTYEVAARYEYEWQGVRHVGHRVGLHSGDDNIGSYHQDKHLELLQHVGSGEPTSCYIDPDDPKQAVLDRSMRWGVFAFMALLATVLTGARFGFLSLIILSMHKHKAQQALEESYPEDPWRWRLEWQEGRIESTGKAGFILPAVMATLWNLVSAPLAFLIPGEVLDTGSKLYYQIKAETQHGKSHVAANRIGSLSLARRIADSMA